MIIRRFEDLEKYSPPGHQGVVNRLLAGRSLGDGDSVSVWHGRLQPGGRSDLHTHEGSLQIYFAISGEMVVGDGNVESVLTPLGTVVVPVGSQHFIENRSSRLAEILVISVPALR